MRAHRSQRSLGRLVRALALAAALAGRAPAAAAPDDPRAELARLLLDDAAGADPAARAGAIAELPGAAQAWLAVRGAGTLPADGVETALSGEQQLVLGLAVPLLPRPEALLAAQAVAADAAAAEGARLAALELLGAHASASELGMLGRLALEEPGAPPAPDLAAAFEAALAAVLKRDDRAYQALARMGAVDQELVSSVARALGRAGRAQGLPWLLDAFDDGAEAGVALQEIERLAPHAPADLAAEVAEVLRPMLRDEDAAQRKRAIRVLATVRDDASVPDLVAIVAACQGGEAQAAQAALRAITGRNLPARGDLWNAWYQGELRWLHAEGPAILARLASESEADVIAAARALADRSLYRGRAGEELARLVAQHPSPAVRAEACRGLARLDARFQLDALAAALDDAEAAVRESALASLRALTGLDLPEDPEAWRDALAAR